MIIYKPYFKAHFYLKDALLAFCFVSMLVNCSVSRADTYQLSIAEQAVDLIGKKQRAILANQSLPGPTLHWREGETVTIKVTNHLSEPTSVHWHGIILPYQMDGVPGVSFAGIEPGQTFTYQFKVNQSGTYWYHSHSGFQEQLGLFGALIIDPADSHYQAEKDYVVLLSDWPEADPERTLARLKKQSDYYNFQKRTVFDFFTDIKRLGFWETVNNRLAWGWMRMEPTDLADVTGATYHFLINGHTPEMNWTGLFTPGEKIRLRIINGSAMTHFDIRIPGLKMQVIEADGQPVKPISVEEFRIAVAETYDVVVQPEANKAYSIFAEAMDRSGYASATLTPNSNMKAKVPVMRPLTLLTLADMGGMHSDHQAPMKAEGKPTSSAHPRYSPEGMVHAMPEPDVHSAHHGNMTHAAEPAVEMTPVLSYQALQADQNGPYWSKPDRNITLRLTGNMNRYIWSFDDLKYSEAEPIKVKLGEHIRLTYVNETMMNHPIHLHGLWQYLDNGHGRHNPKKHVINVKPGETVKVDVIADAEGAWAFHCHLLYHMDTGMFRKFIVSKAESRSL